MRKKNKVHNKIKLLVALVAFISIVIYVIYNIVELVKEPTEVFVIEKGSIYAEEMVTAYVIRNEQVIKGENYKNGIYQIKTEGQKVAKEDAVFRYYSKNEEELLKKIEDLDIKIEQAMEEQTNIYSSDIRLLEKQSNDILNKISKTNNIEQIAEYKKNINDIVTKKAKMAGELSPAGSYIKELINERSSYETQLNSGSEYVKAPISGIVSYKVDGLEEVLSPNDFSKITKEVLENINIKTGQIIATNNEAGKIIQNFNCYLAVILNSEESQNATLNQQVKLRLSTNKEVSAKIVNIQKVNEDNIIIFEIDDNIEEFINYRKISINIIWWSHSGLKVPNSAIICEEEKKYVIRNRAGYTDKILVKVLKQNDNYTIIGQYKTEELQKMGYTLEEIGNMKNINLYDEIKQNPTK